MTGIEIAIQVLTCSALVGLLGAVGLRLTYAEVKAALSAVVSSQYYCSIFSWFHCSQSPSLISSVWSMM